MCKPINNNNPQYDMDNKEENQNKTKEKNKIANSNIEAGIMSQIFPGKLN